MAKIEHSPIIDGISGKVGNLVFRTRKDGAARLGEAVGFRERTSSEQGTQQEGFEQAGRYAREAARIVPLYASLAAKSSKSAYAIAFSDWLHAPEIQGVERYIGHIDIYASDDVRVEKIYVTIFNEQGITLEQGSATLVHEGYWKYETEVPGSVLVEAFDLAGNVTRWTGALPGTSQGPGYAAQSPFDAA